jgi:hypothetical protein
MGKKAKQLAGPFGDTAPAPGPHDKDPADIGGP